MEKVVANCIAQLSKTEWLKQFPPAARPVVRRSREERMEFWEKLSEMVEPQPFVAHVLWRFIMPFKKDGVKQIIPFPGAPLIRSEEAQFILERISAFHGPSRDRAAHGINEIIELCEQVLEPGFEFTSPQELFKRLFSRADFRFNDWKVNPSADGGQPIFQRTIRNALRKASGRRRLAQEAKPGKEPDGTIDDSWKTMLAVDRVRGNRMLYRYVGGKRADPIERMLEEKMEEDDGSGQVYAMTNPAWPGWVKIGMTVNIDDRIECYQTGAPERDYQMFAHVSVEDRRGAETRAHSMAEEKVGAVNRNHEWFRIENSDAKEILEKITEQTSQRIL